MTLGNVFNIQKYSIHDGPGIRTTVFLKGCPLTCLWCHNPESQSFSQEIIFSPNKCINCGECYSNCSNGAIQDKQGPQRLNDKCTLCGSCTDKCPTEAMELVGRNYRVQEIMKEIEKDSVFYEESGGGVTFSGGEPLSQHEFLSLILKECKSKGLHTAVDTSGYCPWEVLDKISEDVDLFLYDIKHMDEKAHMELTGVSNEVIIENLRLLAAKDKTIWIRVPIIPGLNDDEENINSIGEMMNSINLRDIFILPYHNIMTNKYDKLNQKYTLVDIKTPSDEYMEEIASRFKKYGLKVKIGG